MGNETFYGDGVGKLNVSNANGTNYVEIRKPTTKKDSLSFQQSSTFWWESEYMSICKNFCNKSKKALI